MIFDWASPKRLREAGILGMNRRNHSYILKYNPRKCYPRVDNKILTKRLATELGVNTAGLIGEIEFQHDVANLPEIVKDHREFVIKPAHGSGGRGILVIEKHNGRVFFKTGGQKLRFHQVYRHISNILSGLYSLGGQVDVALIEERIQFTDIFDGFSFQGIPDVRVIVFKGFPVMAMCRLSTRASDGKANLHQGAVGVGLSLRDGSTLHAVQHGKLITRHPDTGKELKTLQIPLWDEHLRLAASCSYLCGLGYFGADIALDRERGPLLLELNARPGLAIQVANQTGLASRLELVESLNPADYPNDAARIAFSQAHFN